VIRREPPQVRLIQDAIRVACFGAIGLAVLAAVRLPPRIEPAWLDTAGRALAAGVAHLLTVMVLRELVPRPRIGSHLVGKDDNYLRWLASSAYADAVNHPLVRWPYGFLSITQFVYLRAQGAQVRYGASLAWGRVTVREPSLLEVETGAQLEPGVIVEAALGATGRLRVDRVAVGGGCLVGANVVLMPGATLGHDARVGPGAYIGPDVSIGVGTKIGERAVLAAGVDVGAHVRIGAGAVIGENARIADSARVRTGAVIPPGTQVRENEVWQGVPARALFRDARGRTRDEYDD
jgi:carbonic anhydrase/acetyltransferase-like protein (isoleucine patch superfamily)